MRLLHVVENMNDQAVENWLFRIMRDARAEYPGVHWTFYSVLDRPGRLDDAVREMGGEVIHSPVPLGDTVRFAREMHSTIKRGRYDVIHSHHDILSAVYLVASLGTGVSQRVVHVHNTSMSLPTPSPSKRAMMREPMRRTCLALADRIAGISRDALASMILDAPPRHPRDVVVYYGIDTARFKVPRRSPADTRRSIDVDANSEMILFAGRMTEYKNPRFVVNVLAEIATEMPNAVAVFAGVGPESDAVARLAADTGLAGRIRILGWRDDLAELMLAADLLLWPGHEIPKEGLGLGVVEAQAAGLPIIMSRSVPDDAIVIEDMVSVLPLASGQAAWGREALRRLRAPRPDGLASVECIDASPFSLAAGTANLMALYANLPSR